MTTTKYALYSPSLGFFFENSTFLDFSRIFLRNFSKEFSPYVSLFTTERGARFKKEKFNGSFKEELIILPVVISYTFEVPSSTNSIS